MNPSNPEKKMSADFPRRGDILATESGANFTAVDVGETAGLMRYGVDHPLGRTLWGKVFLKEPLGLTGMEISLGVVPPGASIPFFHRHHQNEETYLFLRGKGEFQVDGRVIRVHEGTAVRVAPAGVRAFRNTGDDGLFYVVVQAKAGTLSQWTGSDGSGVPGEVTWP